MATSFSLEPITDDLASSSCSPSFFWPHLFIALGLITLIGWFFVMKKIRRVKQNNPAQHSQWQWTPIFAMAMVTISLILLVATRQRIYDFIYQPPHNYNTQGIQMVWELIAQPVYADLGCLAEAVGIAPPVIPGAVLGFLFIIQLVVIRWVMKKPVTQLDALLTRKTALTIIMSASLLLLTAFYLFVRSSAWQYSKIV